MIVKISKNAGKKGYNGDSGREPYFVSDMVAFRGQVLHSPLKTFLHHPFVSCTHLNGWTWQKHDLFILKETVLTPDISLYEDSDV